MLDDGVDVDMAENGYSRLHAAATAGREDMIALLVAHGADVSDDGESALATAARVGRGTQLRC